MCAKVNRNRLILVAILLVALRPPALAQEWYVSYGKGLEAFRRQQWQEAVSALNDAIGEKSESKAKAKTYGMQFIDYFPYVYRGVAYYKLGDREKAQADLEKAEGEGVVGNAREDDNAPRLLREYLDLVRKKSPAAAPQPDAKYAEGMRLFNRKEYAASVEQLKGVAPAAKEHKDAQKYIGLAQAEMKKAEGAATARDRKDRIDKAFAGGVKNFNNSAFDQAEADFTTVLGLDNARADARQYLTRIKSQKQKLAAAAKQSREQIRIPVREPVIESAKPAPGAPANPLLSEAVALYSEGKVARAKPKFEQVRRNEPDNADAENYLRVISETTQRTRNGITSFFEGEYQQAIDQLSESAKKERDNAHLYAFLACSYAAKFLLAGEEDGTLRDNAVSAYVLVKSVDANYALDKKIISPRIVSILDAP